MKKKKIGIQHYIVLNTLNIYVIIITIFKTNKIPIY